MRDSGNIRVYPEYFDSSLTRSEGRRVSRRQALENPTLGELKISAEKLNFSVEYQKETAYPRQWDKPKGVLYIAIPESEKIIKTKLLKDLSKTVKEFARPYLKKKQEELAKAEAKAGKKVKIQMPTSQRIAEKKHAGKPMRRRR